jgi:hypothetical protein
MKQATEWPFLVWLLIAMIAVPAMITYSLLIGMYVRWLKQIVGVA